MRNVSFKNNKFLPLTVSSLFCLIIGVIAFGFGATGIRAKADSIENLKDRAYLSAHYTDGTMGMILDESYNSIEYAEMRTNYSHLQKTILLLKEFNVVGYAVLEVTLKDDMINYQAKILHQELLKGALSEREAKQLVAKIIKKEVI